MAPYTPCLSPQGTSTPEHLPSEKHIGEKGPGQTNNTEGRKKRRKGKAINFISQLPKTVHHRNDSGPHADQEQVSRAGFYPLGLL